MRGLLLAFLSTGFGAFAAASRAHARSTKTPATKTTATAV